MWINSGTMVCVWQVSLLFHGCSIRIIVGDVSFGGECIRGGWTSDDDLSDNVIDCITWVSYNFTPSAAIAQATSIVMILRALPY